MNREEVLKKIIQEFADNEDDFTSGVKEFAKTVNYILKNDFGCSEDDMLISLENVFQIIPEIIDTSKAKYHLLP